MSPLDEAPHGLVGQSPRIRQIQKLVEKIGHSPWPCLLLGETGTGKEVVARAIHRVNPAGPFITIDCSSLVGPLMESELFGHARGSFTGAVAAKAGLIELANGGTAFFDEIGELPLELQAKLLRVLQQKEFRPVGSLQTRHSEFRVVAATNRDLAEEVEKGRFRRDLYYRLNVVTIRLAPLRERREDIAPLIAHFLHKHGRGQTLEDDALELMLAYDWPGNVRELENAIQHMVALHTGPVMSDAALPSALRNFRLARQLESGWTGVLEPQPARPAAPLVTMPLPEADPEHAGVLPLVEVERRAIMRALEVTRGDRAVAAHLLGIGRTTLYRKLKEYEVAV